MSGRGLRPSPAPLVVPGGGIGYAGVSTVATAGGDYTSLEAALAAVTTTPWLIWIFPGPYTENPCTIPAGVTVLGAGDWTSVVLTANNNAAHFLTVQSGGALGGVTISGPTGAGRAGVRCNDVAPGAALLDRIIFTAGYYDLLVDPAAAGGAVQAQGLIGSHTGAQAVNFCRVVDHGSLSAQLCSALVLGATTAAFYCEGDGTASASMTLDGCSVAAYAAVDGVYADNGGTVRLVSCSFRYAAGGPAGNAIHTGGTGATTSLLATGCICRGNWTLDLHRDTSTTVFGYQGAARRANLDWGLSTANFSANVTDATTGDSGTVLLGETWIGNEELGLVQYTTGRRSTGIVSGFTVSNGAGLVVNVAAGVGYVADATGQIQRVVYAGGSKALTANKPYVYLYCDGSGVLQESFVQPNAERNLLVTTAATGAAAVTLLAPDRVPLPFPDYSLWLYNTEVIGPINVSGGVVTLDAAPLKLDVTDSRYYTHYYPLASTGATPVSLRRWYHDGAGAWVCSAVVDTIDDTQYDTGAGLSGGAAWPNNVGRGELYVVTNDAATEYHWVYPNATTLYADVPSAQAGANPEPPPILQYEGCRLAATVATKAGGVIDAVVDQRPRLGQLAATSGAAPVSHSGLAEPGMATLDNHPQYQLRAEQSVANGYPSLDAGALVPIGELPSATAAPPACDATASQAGGGTGLLAFEDHQHEVSTGLPAAITPGDAQGPGVSDDLARADHVHAVPAFGTVAGTFCEGDDARLRDFGADFEVQQAAGPSDNATAVYSNFVTLTTGALTGTYRVAYYAGLTTTGNNRDVEARLYNETDATELLSSYARVTTLGQYHEATGFAFVTFAGVAKTLRLQWRAPNADTTARIRRGKIEFWRVS